MNRLCHLLGLAAHPKLAMERGMILKRAAGEYQDWASLPREAERVGVAPLLYRHLTDWNVAMPPDAGRPLKAIYLRQRRIAAIQMAVLREILAAYQANGIDTVLLKGAALVHQIYPEPGLRPMDDLDLLVPVAQAEHAQAVLRSLGFQAPASGSRKNRLFHHLPLASRRIDGYVVQVEVHRNVFSNQYAASLDHARMQDALELEIGGGRARTLGHAQALWHLCHHLISIGQPLRFSGVADIVGYADRFAAEIDWPLLRRRYPRVLRTLALLDYLSPLAPETRVRAGLEPGVTPAGVGRDYEGWPRTRFLQARTWPGGATRLLRDTLFPADWWLRLYYGLDSRGPLFATRWLRHPGRLLKLGLKRWYGTL